MAGEEKAETKKRKEDKQRYALTLGEQSLLHIGGKVTGKGLAEEGFTPRELFEIYKKFPTAEFTLLSSTLPKEERKGNEAAFLLIKGGIDVLMGAGYADKMKQEQSKVEYDRFYWENRFKKMLNKRARYNTVFGEKHIDHNKDYSQSTVIAWDEVPLFKALRQKLPEVFGEKARNLNAEGSFYFEEKSKIGFHGDSERKIVICCSLGAPATLRFIWRAPGSSDVYKGPFDFTISTGDLYCMSSKCSGWDWMKRSSHRLVHAAGAGKYLKC